jgi:hypothetical protein
MTDVGPLLVQEPGGLCLVQQPSEVRTSNGDRCHTSRPMALTNHKRTVPQSGCSQDCFTDKRLRSCAATCLRQYSSRFPVFFSMPHDSLPGDGSSHIRDTFRRSRQAAAIDPEQICPDSVVLLPGRRAVGVHRGREYWVTAAHIITGATGKPYGRVKEKTIEPQLLNSGGDRLQWLPTKFTVLQPEANVDVVALAPEKLILATEKTLLSPPASSDGFMFGAPCEFLGYPLGGGWRGK